MTCRRRQRSEQGIVKPEAGRVLEFRARVAGRPHPAAVRPLAQRHQTARGQMHAMGADPAGECRIIVDEHQPAASLHPPHHLTGEALPALRIECGLAHLHQTQAGLQRRIERGKLGRDTKLGSMGDAHQARQAQRLQDGPIGGQHGLRRGAVGAHPV